jgi:aspartyl-tRNA synthetase
MAFGTDRKVALMQGLALIRKVITMPNLQGATGIHNLEMVEMKRLWTEQILRPSRCLIARRAELMEG